VDWYRDNRNVMVVEMVYLGYFGLGHNVNWSILERGDVDVEALVVDQP
jgi:hypothetical protein